MSFHSYGKRYFLKFILYLHITFFFFFLSTIIGLCYFLLQTLYIFFPYIFMKLLSVSIDIYFFVNLKLFRKAKDIKQINIARAAREITQADQDIQEISKVKQLTLSS